MLMSQGSADLALDPHLSSSRGLPLWYEPGRAGLAPQQLWHWGESSPAPFLDSTADLALVVWGHLSEPKGMSLV